MYSYQICGSLHREFAKLCIKSKCYQHALQVIDHPTTSFKKYTSPMDIVSYLYYKGLIYLGLKRYADAEGQFRLVLSFPSHIVHKVHCEAYKKLIILTLLKVANGQIPAAGTMSRVKNVFPKDVNIMLKQRLEHGFPLYQKLAETFLNRDKPLEFEELFRLGQKEFTEDKNWGLVKKLAKVYREPLRLRLVEHADTYLTLKNSEIDTSTYLEGVPNANLEATVFGMITSGQVKAKLDAKQAMISFIDAGQDSTYLPLVEELEQQNIRIIELMKQAQQVDSGIRMSKEYLKRDLLNTGGGALSSIDEQSFNNSQMRA